MKESLRQPFPPWCEEVESFSPGVVSIKDFSVSGETPVSDSEQGTLSHGTGGQR